jgi:hypothetical protein
MQHGSFVVSALALSRGHPEGRCPIENETDQVKRKGHGLVPPSSGRAGAAVALGTSALGTSIHSVFT